MGFVNDCGRASFRMGEALRDVRGLEAGEGDCTRFKLPAESCLFNGGCDGGGGAVFEAGGEVPEGLRAAEVLAALFAGEGSVWSEVGLG